MAQARLTKVGDSTVLAIPAAILDELRIGSDSALNLAVRDGMLVIKPERKRYTLEELLAECDGEAPLATEEREWIDAPAVGREIVP